MPTTTPKITERPMLEPVGYHSLHPDRGIEFQLNRFLQYVGPSGLEEIRDAARQISTYPEWIATFLALAETAREQNRELAGACYDRAAHFFMTVEDPRRAGALARFLDGARRAYGLEPIAVPYADGYSLHAYELLPDGPARGTIVITGGFDEYIEELFGVVVTVAAAGYRVIAFDGPGQGVVLDAGLVMTPSWERPVGAVLDHFGLDDVTLIGISLGGGLAIRAAACEPRIRRVVAHDVLDDFLQVLARQTSPGAEPMVRALLTLRARRVINLIGRARAARKPLVAWGLQQGTHVTGTDDAFGFFAAARELNTHKVSKRVSADVLLLAGAEDHYVPVSQLQRQAGALTGARSVTTRLFTRAEGAQNHCQFGNLNLCFETILAWVEAMSNDDRAPLAG